MKKYAYVFAVSFGSKPLMWSGEDEKTLPNRAANEDDKDMIKEFIAIAGVGSFITLSTGEMIFRTQ